MPTSHPYDLAVIGAGIVGLAVAHRYAVARPRARVVVIEKEDRIGAHQSGRNSGVVHSGLYYRPGSRKAALARRGADLLEAFCAPRGIPFERCGKVVVATNEAEAARLDDLLRRGRANAVECRRIDAAELRRIEPAAAGVAAIHVPGAGIVDFSAVCGALATDIRASGGEIELGCRAEGVTRAGDDGVIIQTERREFTARQLINCAGLHADRVARTAGAPPPATLIPFRGEYFELRPSARDLVRSLIYPVPDPAFPFLGVHFTRTTATDANGPRIECGPNAALAFAREGYTKDTIDAHDLAGMLTNPAFLRLAARYWRTGLAELHRSYSRPAFARALQRLIPDIREDDLERAPAGVRAQAVSPQGKLLDDFVIVEDPPMLHVVNAPSPAATASLAIAGHLVDRIGDPRA